MYHTVESCIFTYLLIQAIFFNHQLGNYYSTPATQLRSSYDFIIVGGGASGGVIASRLSEDPSINVLLMEEGGYANYYSDIPLIYCSIQDATGVFSTKYESLPQKGSCNDLPGDKCAITVGKSLGGGGSHNQMFYFRGSPMDFDQWCTNYNISGWSYKDVLPYFKKMENMTDEQLARDIRYHSTTGPAKISVSKLSTPVKAWLDAAKFLNFTIGDYTAGKPDSFYSAIQTKYNGQRTSSQTAYIDPILGTRRNLHILCFAEVQKIEIVNNRAIGVTFIRDGKRFTIRTTKEVILSAGGVSTPKLLMVSGIGPKSNLEAAKIPVIKNSPGVGENFQNIIEQTIIFDTTLDLTRFIHPSLEEYHKFQLTREGIFNYDGYTAVGFVKTKFSNPAYGSNDTRICYYFAVENSFKKFGEPDPTYGNHSFNVGVASLANKSRGKISLNTTNPFGPPVILTNFMTEKQDRDNLIDGIKILLKFMDAPSMKAIKAKPRPLESMGPKQSTECNQKLWSDEYLECSIKKPTTDAINQYSGTARMGSLNDPMAVVDSNLKVIGIQGLRVADASIMPTLVRSSNHGTCLMISEKAADIIKKTYSLRSTSTV